MLLVHHFHAALQDGYLMLQGNDLVFDGIGQAVMIEVDVAFAVAGFDAFALLDDDAARDAVEYGGTSLRTTEPAPIFAPSPTVKEPRTLAPQATTT